MSRSTLSPDTPKLDTVLVTRVGPMMGYAFGVASDGGAVFICASLTQKLGVTPGDRVEGAIVPNRVKPGHTPWFLQQGVVIPAGEQRTSDTMTLLSVLDDMGGAWGAAELGAELGDDAAQCTARASAAMEVAHTVRWVSKIVMFDHTSEDRKVWYTRRPDRIDADEFED